MNGRLALVAGLSISALAHAGKFAAFRYDDDFSGASGDNGYEQIKHIDLGAEGRYLSFGGDLRERGEYFSHSNIGAKAAAYDSFILQRLLLHADAHWDRARVFLQLGNYEEFGREPQPKPSDVDHLDIRQAFVDYRIAADAGEWTLRGGRQEIAYGASRLISVRDGPNIRLAFDGVRIDFRNEAWKVSGIAVRPAENTAPQFDDKTSRSQSLWGVYATYADTAAALRSDWYYFGSTSDDMRYQSISGDERRNTIGIRFYGGSGDFDGDVELILQNGAIGGRDIRAFALATDSGWTWRDRKWKPRLGLRTDIISGDRDAADGTLGTFNALFPTGSYFSEASVLAQANLLDFAASITLKPLPQLTLSRAINPLWRYSVEDALYTLPLAPLIAGDSSGARYIGTQNQLIAVWQCNDYLSFKAALVKFVAGDFVERGRGHDLDYAQLATSIRF